MSRLVERCLPLVSDDDCPFIFEDLSTGNVIPVVVAVEEVLDGLIGDLPDRLQHLLGVISSHRFNDHDSITCHNEHGEISIASKTIDSIRNFESLQGEYWNYLEKKKTSSYQQHLQLDLAPST